MANEVEIVVSSKDQTGSGFRSTTQGAEKLEGSLKSLGHTTVQTGRNLERTGRTAEDSADRIRRTAEATDEMDTVGSKATSSLGALSSGFELVGNNTAAEGIMRASLATDFLSGVGEAATLVVDNLRNAFSKAASFLMGPWGIAILAAAAAAAIITTAFISMGAEARKAEERKRAVSAAAEELKDTLDEETGAITRNTREWAFRRLEQNNLIDTARRLDINISTLVDAMMGERNALDSVNRSIEAHKRAALEDSGAMDDLNAQLGENVFVVSESAKETAIMGEDVQRLADELGISSDALEEARRRQAEYKEAVERAAQAARSQVVALEDLAETLRAQANPMFALIKAQKDVKEAQEAHTEAVKKFGTNSPEARAKALALAEAVVGLTGAAQDAAESGFEGRLTPSMKAAMEAAGLTASQIDAVERQAIEARRALEKFQGNYSATVTTRNVRIWEEQGSWSGQGGRAHGGITGAAGGGPRGDMTLVGENGPELVDLPPGTQVHSNPDTERILSGQMNQALQPAREPMVLEFHVHVGDEVVRVVRREISDHDRDIKRRVMAGEY